MKEYIINQKDENQRLDKYLKKLLPNASSGFLYKMIRKKNILLNKKKATGNEILSKNDKVQIYFSDETFHKFSMNITDISNEIEILKSYSMNGITIVYEDDEILIANKPINMLSQKAHKDDVTANEYLLGYLLRNNSLSDGDFSTFRPSVCNRLDRNTTGLLLMGKTLHGAQMLSQMLRDRTIKKYYRAIVLGCVKKKEHLSGYLLKDKENNKVSITRKASKNASRIETAYEPVESTQEYSMIEIHLITGKTHQIRAHLASVGHPIIGDMKYGNNEMNHIYYKKYSINCQLLHAYRLEFPDGRIFTAPLPKIYDSLRIKE